MLYPEVRNQHHCMESKHKPIHCFSQRPASQASLGWRVNPHVATSHCITTSSCLFKRHLSLNSRPHVNNPGYFILSHICKDPISYLRSHLRRNRLDPVGASSQLYIPTPLELFSWASRSQTRPEVCSASIQARSLCKLKEINHQLSRATQKARETVNCQK